MLHIKMRTFWIMYGSLDNDFFYIIQGQIVLIVNEEQ